MKPDFERAQNTATELLLSQNINSLYIDVRDFTLPKNITIDSFQNFATISNFPIERVYNSNIEGACTINCSGTTIILYDDTITNEQRKHWGIVHELGHAFLGHKDDDRKSEIEAHFFAAQIIAPEIVLWDLVRRVGKLTCDFLYDNFNISYEAAQKRIHTLGQRNGFSCAEIDERLLRKFEPILDKVSPRLFAS